MIRARRSHNEERRGNITTLNYFNGHSWQHIATVFESWETGIVSIEDPDLAELVDPGSFDDVLDELVEIALGDVEISEIQMIDE